MPVRFASAAHAAGTRHATARRSLIGRTLRGRGERRKLLGQLLRTAMRAFCPLPVAGADKNLAIFLALPAMKFIDRHGKSLNVRGGMLNLKTGTDFTGRAEVTERAVFIHSTGMGIKVPSIVLQPVHSLFPPLPTVLLARNLGSTGFCSYVEILQNHDNCGLLSD